MSKKLGSSSYREERTWWWCGCRVESPEEKQRPSLEVTTAGKPHLAAVNMFRPSKLLPPPQRCCHRAEGPSTPSCTVNYRKLVAVKCLPWTFPFVACRLAPSKNHEGETLPQKLAQKLWNPTLSHPSSLLTVKWKAGVLPQPGRSIIGALHQKGDASLVAVRLVEEKKSTAAAGV